MRHRTSLDSFDGVSVEDFQSRISSCVVKSPRDSSHEASACQAGSAGRGPRPPFRALDLAGVASLFDGIAASDGASNAWIASVILQSCAEWITAHDPLSLSLQCQVFGSAVAGFSRVFGGEGRLRDGYMFSEYANDLVSWAAWVAWCGSDRRRQQKVLRRVVWDFRQVGRPYIGEPLGHKEAIVHALVLAHVDTVYLVDSVDLGFDGCACLLTAALGLLRAGAREPSTYLMDYTDKIVHRCLTGITGARITPSDQMYALSALGDALVEERGSRNQRLDDFVLLMTSSLTLGAPGI